MRTALDPVMRKLLLATLLVLTATGGTALADRHRGNDHRGNQHRSDHRRGDNHARRDNGHRTHVRDHRAHRDHRRPVYASNNRFVFGNGHVRYYNRPVIRTHYTNYRYRPALIVENYEQVPGYIWVAGNWQWNGYQWMWIDGHYEVDAAYGYSY
jgi:hypothetical protein